jgi:hypothetical protein
MNETAQDRRMAFAKRDFLVVLQERGGWDDFHKVVKIPKPVPMVIGEIKIPHGSVISFEAKDMTWTAPHGVPVRTVQVAT